MQVDRIVPKNRAAEKVVSTIVVREYYKGEVPNLGLATANMSGRYPPEGEGQWSRNEKVEEMWYVVEGKATIHYHDGL